MARWSSNRWNCGTLASIDNHRLRPSLSVSISPTRTALTPEQLSVVSYMNLIQFITRTTVTDIRWLFALALYCKLGNQKFCEVSAVCLMHWACHQWWCMCHSMCDWVMQEYCLWRSYQHLFMCWKMYTPIHGILIPSITLLMYYSAQLLIEQLVTNHLQTLFKPLLSCLIVKRFAVFLQGSFIIYCVV